MYALDKNSDNTPSSPTQNEDEDEDDARRGPKDASDEPEPEPVERKAEWDTRSRTRSGLVEFPSKGARSPHQLLELVLLHLDLAAALGADGVHGAVVSHALEVSHARC